jgi:uncharacterized protein YndB with AHSA1/START domain
MSSSANPAASAAGSSGSDSPVRKTVTVRVSPERAFEVFTAGFDSWWPRSHHIGKSPMKKAVIEGHVGGRCFSLQEDGEECPWGQVTAWEPPRRFVMAWMISAQWQYEPDLEKSSEVEVSFTAQADGSTRVDLEHRGFERMGEGGEAMRNGVNAEGGWGSLLTLFTAEAEKEAPQP